MGLNRSFASYHLLIFYIPQVSEVAPRYLTNFRDYFSEVSASKQLIDLTDDDLLLGVGIANRTHRRAILLRIQHLRAASSAAACQGAAKGQRGAVRGQGAQPPASVADWSAQDVADWVSFFCVPRMAETLVCARGKPFVFTAAHPA